MSNLPLTELFAQDYSIGTGISLTTIGHKNWRNYAKPAEGSWKTKNLYTPQNLPSTLCTRCTRTIYHKINFFADSESKLIFKNSQRTPNSSDNFYILGAWEYRGGTDSTTPARGRVNQDVWAIQCFAWTKSRNEIQDDLSITLWGTGYDV